MNFDLISVSPSGELCARAFVAAGLELRSIFTLTPALLPEKAHSFYGLSMDCGAPLRAISDICDVARVEPAPDYLLCVRFSKLLPPDVITYPKQMTIGGHPTPLPYGRGRHPIQWQIVLGYTVSAFTFFKMDSGVDTGDILHVVPYQLRDQPEPASSRESDLAAELGARQLAKMLLNGGVASRPQPEQGTKYRKRDPHDGFIDFRMSCVAIQRLVRTGYAHLRCNGECHRVTSAIAHPLPPHRQGHGFVHHARGCYLEVEADDGIVAITTLTPPPPITWVHPPSYYA